MNLITLVLRYAVIATIANLAMQRLVFLGGDTIWYFMAAGTLVGLVIKYLLDKLGSSMTCPQVPLPMATTSRSIQ